MNKGLHPPVVDLRSHHLQRICHAKRETRQQRMPKDHEVARVSRRGRDLQAIHQCVRYGAPVQLDRLTGDVQGAMLHTRAGEGQSKRAGCLMRLWTVAEQGEEPDCQRHHNPISQELPEDCPPSGSRALLLSPGRSQGRDAYSHNANRLSSLLE